MGPGATAQADALAAVGAGEAETPWFEDGTDYGRDLGTGVPEDAVDYERTHQADVPRTYEGPDDPLFPARPEGDDAEAAGETPVAAPAAPTSNAPTRVPPPPPGNTEDGKSKADKPNGTPPSAPEGGNG